LKVFVVVTHHPVVADASFFVSAKYAVQILCAWSGPVKISGVSGRYAETLVYLR
jgi:hypothetical protein